MEATDIPEAQIGDNVTIDNVTGELLCSSESGVTPMDLFNVVLTDYGDLKSFLGPGNYSETDQGALYIKAYLKFCATTNTPLWTEEIKPLDATFDHDDSQDIFESDEEEIKEEYEEVPSDQPETQPEFKPDCEPELEEEEENQAPSGDSGSDWEAEELDPEELKKNCYKTAEEIKKEEETEQEQIEKCCQICYPDQQIDWPFHIQATKVDKILSKHYYEVHDIKEPVWHELNFLDQLEEYLDTKSYDQANNHIWCKKCPFEFKHRSPHGRNFQRFRMAQHLQSNCGEIPGIKGMRSCRKCGEKFEIDYFAENMTPFKKYTMHWEKHSDDGFFACDYCGETMSSKKAFQVHLAKHDDQNKFECRVCGKLCVSEQNLKNHMKYEHTNKKKWTSLKCQLCNKTFKATGSLQSHMVRDHGAERQFKCEHCPADFIRQSHLARHTKQFHGPNSDPNKVVTVRRRGPNKKRSL